MATFYTDSDLSGAGEFVESEVWIAGEFTPATSGTATYRWRWPTVAPGVTPVVRVFNASDTLVFGPHSFASSTLDAWNPAGTGDSWVAGTTYRVAVNTTRYVARTGFFSGGPIARGDLTGVQSRFGAPGSAPASTSTAAYFIDVDFTSGSASPALPDAASAVDVLALAATTGLSDAGAVAELLAASGVVALADVAAAAEALTVAVTLPLADHGAAAELVDNGASIPKSLADAASALERLRTITVRPNTGITLRPNAGITLRP